MKRCCHCKELLPLSEFGYHATLPENRNRICKPCTRSAMAAQRLQLKQMEAEQAAGTYIQRHKARREQEREIEATLMSLDPQPEPREVFAASYFVGLIDPMLRPKTRESKWIIR